MFPLIVLHGSGRSDCLPQWAIPCEAGMNEIGRSSPQLFALHRALSRTSINDKQIVTRFFANECDAQRNVIGRDRLRSFGGWQMASWDATRGRKA
jgi:hypothetical protein